MTDLLSRVSRSAFGYLGGDGGGGGGGGENEFVGSIVDVDGMQIQVRLIPYILAEVVCYQHIVTEHFVSKHITCFFLSMAVWDGIVMI